MMYSKTPRLVKAVRGRDRHTLVIPSSRSCATVRAGWDTLVRRGDKALKAVPLELRRVVDGVEIHSRELRAIQTYLVGDWLTSSNSVRRTPAALRRLGRAAWSAWLTRAFYNGTLLGQFAVVWTISKFMHVDRRRSRGMIVGARLYGELPRFLHLYTAPLARHINRGRVLEPVRALLQLNDRHYWSRDAKAAAREALDEVSAMGSWDEVRRLVDRRHDSRRYLGPGGHLFLYEFILDIARTTPDLALILFEGITLQRPATRPRRIRGKWTGSPPPRHGGAGRLFELLHCLEFNAFLPKDERYTVSPTNIHNTDAHHARTLNVWATRRVSSIARLDRDNYLN